MPEHISTIAILDAFDAGRRAAGGGKYVPQLSDYRLHEDLERWVNASEPGALAQSLAGFFADPWHRKTGYRFKLWAADPGSFIRAPEPVKQGEHGIAPGAQQQALDDYWQRMVR